MIIYSLGKHGEEGETGILSKVLIMLIRVFQHLVLIMVFQHLILIMVFQQMGVEKCVS